jgi:hypothetical protein
MEVESNTAETHGRTSLFADEVEQNRSPDLHIFFFSNGSTAPRGHRPHHFEASRSHILDTPHSVGLLWTSDQPVAETST